MMIDLYVNDRFNLTLSFKIYRVLIAITTPLITPHQYNTITINYKK